MTIDEINNLHLVDVIGDVLNRLIDTQDMPFGESLYTIDTDVTLSLFDRVKINSAYKMPSLEDMQDEKDKIVKELIEAENYRLAEEVKVAEIERVSILKSRVDALEDIHVLASNIGRHKPNMAIEMINLIKNDDTVFLDALESEMVKHKAKKDKKKKVDDKKKIGKKQEKVCLECLAIIRGENDGKSDDDIDLMISQFLNIYTALIQNRPRLAKSLILNIANDGIIDELKEELLEELSDGGY